MPARLKRLLQWRALWRLAALLGTVVIVIACWTPVERLPQTELLNADKLLHLLAFLVLGFCWHRTGLGSARVLLICLALAIGTEIGQDLLAGGRSGEVLDAVADGIGTVLGILLSIRLARPVAATAPSD